MLISNFMYILMQASRNTTEKKKTVCILDNIIRLLYILYLVFSKHLLKAYYAHLLAVVVLLLLLLQLHICCMLIDVTFYYLLVMLFSAYRTTILNNDKSIFYVQ